MVPASDKKALGQDIVVWPHKKYQTIFENLLLEVKAKIPGKKTQTLDSASLNMNMNKHQGKES